LDTASVSIAPHHILFCLLSSYSSPRHLHSFPTRRSSDLSELDFQLRPSATIACTCWSVADGVGSALSSIELPSPSPRSGQSPLVDRKSTRLNSSHVAISYAVFCLKKKIKTGEDKEDEDWL